MKREKQIQISEKLFAEIVKYFLLDQEPSRADAIKKGLAEKLESNLKHEIYTKYKTAATQEEREKARIEYLDRVGIPSSFRW